MAKTIFVEVVGNASQFKKELESAVASTNKANSSFARMGKAAGVVGLALAGGLTVGLVKSAEAAKEFQAKMELVHTQAGVAQKQIEGLARGVLKLAGPTATAPDTLADGLYHLASQGLRGKGALDALKIAAEGAKVGQANLEDVTNALGAALVSGIKGTKNLEHTMGILNATVGAGDMRMQDLADALGTGLLARAATAGVGIKDVSAALAVFGDNNIRGAEAGTQLSSVLRLISAPSKAAAKALGEVHLKSLDLANTLRTKGLPAALDLLKTKMKEAGLTASQQALLLTRAFGGRQAGGILLLLNQMDRLKTKEKEVGEGGKKFGDAWEQTTKTAKFNSEQLHASLHVLGIEIGSALLPAITTITDALGKFVGFLAQHKGLAEALVIGIAGLAAAFITLSAAIAIAEIAMSPLLVPVLAVIAALAILGTAVYLLITDFKKWWPLLLPIVLGPLGAIIAAVIVWHGKIVGAFEAAWNAVKGATIAAWNAIKGAVTSGVHAVVSAIEGAVGAAVGAAQRLANGVLNAIRSGLSKVGQAVTNAMSALRNALVSAAGDAYRLALSVGHAIVDGVISGLGGLAGRVAGAVKGALSSGIHAVGGILHGSGDFMWTKHAVGEPMVQGIVDGIKAGEPQLEAALKGALALAVANTKKSLKLGPSGAMKDAISSALGLGDDSGSSPWSAPTMDPSRTDASQYGWFDILGNFHTDTPPSGNPSGYFHVSGQEYPVFGMPDMSSFPAGTANFGSAVAPGTIPGAGGDVYVSFPNYVGDKSDMTAMVRTELLRIKSRNGSVGLG